MTLSTSVDTPGDDSRRTDARRARYDALAVVRRETHLRSKTVDDEGNPMPGRLQLCRRAVNDSAGGVSLMVTGSGADARGGVGGLQTCGSVWACPVCSEKINAGRQAELDAGIRGWINAGHAVLFLTLTLRHNKGHRLADLWDAISPAWNRTTSGAGVAWNGGKTDQGDKARFGINGYVRLVETKHGNSGWHPHVHALLFIEKTLTTEQVFDLRSRLFARWEKALADRGFSVLEEVGVDLRPVTGTDALADYFTKNTYGITPSGAAYEVTGSQSKRLGKGGLTPFQLLERMVATGDADDLDRWHEWEKASHGRRQLTWSRGMRQLLALGAEVSDAELAEEDLSGETVLALTRDEWVDGRWWSRLPDLLEALESGTLPQLLGHLNISPHRWLTGAKLGPRGTRGPGPRTSVVPPAS